MYVLCSMVAYTKHEKKFEGWLVCWPVVGQYVEGLDEEAK